MYNYTITNRNEPIKITNKDILVTDVARYYLQIEFFKLFKPDSEVITDNMINSINQLSENKIWALLEAMSFTYGLNGVYYKMSKQHHIWNEEIWHVKDLILTGMNSKANKVIFSESVNGDPIKFKKYLLDYFENAGPNDPDGLMSYRPTDNPIRFEKLIMIEENGQIKMLDGSHRLTEMLLTGVEEVTAYVGHPTPQFSDQTQKVRMGNSIFIMLTILYKRGTDEEKEAVLTLLKQLIGYSVNGNEAVQKYWIDNQRDEDIRDAGLSLLREV